jgi:hypothetical protein
MECSSEGILALRDLTTHEQQHERKRPSSPLYLSDISSLDSKRPRLELNDDESSRESRWSQFRDCANLSTLTEASETQPDLPPELQTTFPIQHVIIAAPQVPDLEKHIDNLAVQLEAWSLVSLKEWRQKQDGDTMEDVATPSSSRQRQKAAQRKLMRTLRRQHEEIMKDDNRDEECHGGKVTGKR